jgi:hypothetical protein
MFAPFATWPLPSYFTAILFYMNDIKLSCKCGNVSGIAHDITPESGNHIVCYCEDCQSFANYLGSESTLDEHNGTDIFQTSYANIEITSGSELLRCITLKPKGLIRWYTSCCKTPVGNTVSGKWPFIGVIHTFMEDTAEREKSVGPVRGRTLIKKDSPIAHLNTPTYKVAPRLVQKMLLWKLRDSNKKNPFFTSTGTPISEPKVLTTN